MWPRTGMGKRRDGTWIPTLSQDNRPSLPKNLWRMTSLLTCWIVLVAEEAFSIYERFKLSEKVRKMLRRPSIFRKVSNFASVITIGVSDPGKNQNNTNKICHKDPGNKKSIGSFDKLTENRRSLLKNYYSMIEKDIDRLNNLCARESSIQLVLQSGCKNDVPCRFWKAGRVWCGSARETREPHVTIRWLIPVRDILSNVPAFQDHNNMLTSTICWIYKPNQTLLTT